MSFRISLIALATAALLGAVLLAPQTTQAGPDTSVSLRSAAVQCATGGTTGQTSALRAGAALAAVSAPAALPEADVARAPRSIRAAAMPEPATLGLLILGGLGLAVRKLRRSIRV